MSDSKKKEDELSNGFNNVIFVNDNPAIDDNDADDLVLEVDDKPWVDNYLEDENYLISNDLLYQLNPNPGIDYNIDPFNKEKPMKQSDSDQVNNEQNSDSNLVFTFSNGTESNETKETKKNKESNSKKASFNQPQHKPLPRVTSHPLQPQMNLYSNINFPNNSFTMNGKSGWICSSCKNFNYEMRTQCNRCGRAQLLYNNYSLNSNSNSNLNNYNGTNQYINEMNMANIKSSNSLSNMPSNKMLSMKYSHSYSPKAKKTDDNKKKPFIEREGDWICYKCKNLNFAFRTTCNRCNLSKVENQQIIQSYMNSYTNVQLVNKFQFDERNQNDNLGSFEYYNYNTPKK